MMKRFGLVLFGFVLCTAVFAQGVRYYGLVI